MTVNDYTSSLVGRVLRASTRGFDCGTHSRNITDIHDFGAYVKAPIANHEDILAIGIIYKIEIKDDQLIAELVLGEEMRETILRDQRENRMIPVEIKVLNIGYAHLDGRVVHSLPPRPPMSLDDVTACSLSEIYTFTQRHDFFRLIVGASEVPVDDLLAAAIRLAANSRADDNERYQYLVSAGQQLARDLSSDLKRLSHVLSLIRP